MTFTEQESCWLPGCARGRNHLMPHLDHAGRTINAPPMSVADVARVHGTIYPPQVYGPTNYRNEWGGALYYGPGTETALKLMAPGHFCPDVCDLDDFGEADTMRGHVIRAFFKVMHYWPKPGVRALWRRPFGPR